MGIYHRVGRHVAPLEAGALLTVLAPRVETIGHASPPVRHHSNTLRAFRSLPLRVRQVRPSRSTNR